MPPPIPQPYPIKLDADHPRQIESNLKMVRDELRWVKRRPTSWRWALVALYNALGHNLALHRPASFLPYTGIGQLTRLFDAVATEHPEIVSARRAVEEVDRLRTAWITRAVTSWPANPNHLHPIFDACLSAIRTLEPMLGATGVEKQPDADAKCGDS